MYKCSYFKQLYNFGIAKLFHLIQTAYFFRAIQFQLLPNYLEHFLSLRLKKFLRVCFAKLRRCWENFVLKNTVSFRGLTGFETAEATVPSHEWRKVKNFDEWSSEKQYRHLSKEAISVPTPDPMLKSSPHSSK